MNHIKRKLLSILLICFFALTALAGCSSPSGSGGNTDTTTPSPSATPEQTLGGTSAPSETPESDTLGMQSYVVGDIFAIDVPTSLKVEESKQYNDRLRITPDDGSWEIFGMTINPLSDWLFGESDASYPMGEADGYVGITSDEYANVYFKGVNGDTSKTGYFTIEIKVATPGGLTVQSLLDDPQIKAMFGSIRTPE